MKLIFLIVTLFSLNCFAGNWRNADDPKTSRSYNKESQCLKDHTSCVDFEKKVLDYHDVVTTEVDDTTKPIYKPKYNLKSCADTQSCQEAMSAEPEDYCQAGDMRAYEKNTVMPGYSYFCYGISGYEKKQVKNIVLNTTKKATYDSEQTQKAAEKQAFDKLSSDANFGAKMIGFVGLRLRAKNLNRAQTKQVMKDYEALIGLLRVGSIVHAKEEVDSITPDGTLISADDKAALLAEINAYLGN